MSLFAEVSYRFNQKKYDVFTRMAREDKWQELYRQFEIRLAIINEIDIYGKVDCGGDGGFAESFYLNGCESAVHQNKETIDLILDGQVVLESNVDGRPSSCYEVLPEEAEEFGALQNYFKKEQQATLVAIPNGLSQEVLLSQLTTLLKIRKKTVASPENLIRKVLIHQKWFLIADLYISQCALWRTPFGENGRRFLLTYREIITLIFPPGYDVSVDTVRQTILPSFEKGLSDDFAHKFFSFSTNY